MSGPETPDCARAVSAEIRTTRLQSGSPPAGLANMKRARRQGTKGGENRLKEISGVYEILALPFEISERTRPLVGSYRRRRRL